MAITRVQQKFGSTGVYPTGKSWTIDLTSAPTVGNCLLIYICSKNPMNGLAIVQGGSSASWTSITSTSNASSNVYVYALLNVPSGSTTTLTLTTSNNSQLFCTIIEELSGLATSSLLDQTANSNGLGNTYSSGTTATTTNATEYWVNIYSYFNTASSGLDATGNAPTNGYTVNGALNTSPNPVKQGDAGWTGSAGPAPSILDTYGMIMAYKIVSSTGTAGGSITDVNSRNNNYLALAITLNGAAAAPTPTPRRQISCTIM